MRHASASAVALAARLSCALTLGLFAGVSAHAGDVQWKKEKFHYTAKGKALKEMLREFGASQGLTVVVGKDVEGTVNGKFALLPESLIDMLAASFGFIWYAEGNVLYVSGANDVRSELIRLNQTNVGRLRESLDRLDLPTRRYPIAYDAKQNTALVSGPSRYVDLVTKTARSVDQGPAVATGSQGVRVFPLRFAWATDITYTQGGRDQVIPGVANVLSRLHQGHATPPRTGTRTPRSRVPYEALRGIGALGSGSALAGRLEGDDVGVPTAFPVIDPNQPQFVADGRMNAVIVRDRPENMAAHEATIRSLDVKPGLVEIEVRIIEVQSDALESLGIDWRLRTGRVDLQVGRGNLPTLSWGTALTDSAPLVGPNGVQPLSPSPAGVLTTVLGDAGRFLIARVNALAEDGRANMLASPKVMTLDNVEAVLENLETFFVRVAGNLDANLFDVSVGTSMRVMPLIVADGDTQQVKLAIRIEDGAITGQAVDQIPVVRRSTITTQSLLGSGQALLIAGYAKESSSDDNAGIPGLSKVPYVGRLFKYGEKRQRKVERFFLLTPRVVTL